MAEREQHDRTAGDVLLRHLDLLHNLARSLTRSREAAEDLVQETCVRALPAWRRQLPDRPDAWLATTCLNAARDAARRRAARPVVVADDGHLLHRPADDDTAEQAVASVRAARVRAAVWQLPTAQREAVALVDLAGLTHQEAADVLGVPRGTVLSRVHRGRIALARQLEEEVAHDRTR